MNVFVSNPTPETALLATESQGSEIVHEVPEGLEIPVERSRIERVFFNLITNALEAMPDGGQIRIGARKAENIVLIDVEDTAPEFHVRFATGCSSRSLPLVKTTAWDWG